MENKITPELIEQAKRAESVESLLALAKENGIVLTAERAGKLFSEWHTTKELSDDELDNVAGGCGDDDDTPRACPKCGSTDLDSFIGDGGYIYLKCKKRFCEAVWKAGEK